MVTYVHADAHSSALRTARVSVLGIKAVPRTTLTCVFSRALTPLTAETSDFTHGGHTSRTNALPGTRAAHNRDYFKGAPLALEVPDLTAWQLLAHHVLGARLAHVVAHLAAG